MASISGPPVAAGSVGILGGPLTLILIGLAFGLAALILVGSPDPHTDTTTSGHLLRDAWDGALYTCRSPTLRGLGISIAVLNLAGGTTAIVLPLIVFDRRHGSELLVGLLFAVSGVFGCVAALASGRLDTRGTEWRLLVVPMALYPVSVDSSCSPPATSGWWRRRWPSAACSTAPWTSPCSPSASGGRIPR